MITLRWAFSLHFFATSFVFFFKKKSDLIIPATIAKYRLYHKQRNSWQSAPIFDGTHQSVVYVCLFYGRKAGLVRC